MDIHELRRFESVYKPSKEVAFCWLRKQYVQLSTEENHTEIVDHANDSLRIWQAAKAQAVSGWIETAIQPPEEGQKVIISGIYGVGIAEFSYLYKDEFVMYDMGASNPILSKDQVKFWMPLPDAPQEPTDD